jgi:hypothetical protein
MKHSLASYYHFDGGTSTVVMLLPVRIFGPDDILPRGVDIKCVVRVFSFSNLDEFINKGFYWPDNWGFPVAIFVADIFEDSIGRDIISNYQRQLLTPLNGRRNMFFHPFDLL